MIWGATPDDWLHFDLVLGLGEDLLPVVANPDAAISPDSKMKSLGKTPSRYNARWEVAGIAKWTQKRATPDELEGWARQPDYGICVQTRHVRALDIDVPDEDLADRIAVRFAELLEVEGKLLALRYRADTGKRLLAFRVPGELGKRIMKVEGGIVEFLATGQQFVAVSTHSSGTRYEWSGGLPDVLHEYSEHAFDRAWRVLVKEFAVEPPTEVRLTHRGERIDGVEDEVATWLVENWDTFGLDRGGARLFLSCPWRDGHSSESGETETAWLLAGSGGKQRGHFKCLHASCAARTDDQFLDAVGYKVAQFTDLSQEVAEAYVAEVKQVEARGEVVSKPRLPLPGFVRDKNGNIEAVIENVSKALEHPSVCDARIRFDTFRGETVIASPDADDWHPFKDADAVQLRITLAAQGFKPVSKEMMRDAVGYIAEKLQFDTAQLWLGSLPVWDGVDRVSRFWSTYWGVADSAYTAAVAAYSWTAQAARVMAPGCQVDMVPVLIGGQGARKSSGFRAMCPGEEFFSKINLEDKEDNIARLLRGTLVGELEELKGLHSRDAESIKAWITTRFEKWVPKFKEYAFTFPRRLVLYGSGNNKGFLDDPTGERRWLPMEVQEGSGVDVEGIERDRDQLWAQGLAMWRDGGVQWREAERLGRGEHAAFKITDAWDDAISVWLDDRDGLDGETRRAVGGFTTADVLRGALGYELKHIGKREEMRVAKVLNAQGFTRRQLWVNGANRKGWVRVETHPPLSTPIHLD